MALCPGLPGWAGTRRNTHPPSWSGWSSSSLYQRLPSTMIHRILLVQITCLAISLHNLFPCPLWSTSWSGALHLLFHTFLHPISDFFCSTCPYRWYCRNLFCCSINIISSIPSLSLDSLLGTLSFTLILHIHLTILISADWSAISFSFLTGHVSLPCSMPLCTQLLCSLPLLSSDISLLVSNGTNCLNLFHPIQILAFTAASASPSTLNISPRYQNYPLPPDLRWHQYPLLYDLYWL